MKESYENISILKISPENGLLKARGCVFRMSLLVDSANSAVVLVGVQPLVVEFPSCDRVEAQTYKLEQVDPSSSQSG